ncbi:MAG: gliding motility-associated ABC transporter substrate-binding protein GldG [Bacteroidia bacterium]
MKSNGNVRWFLIIVLLIVANLILSSFFFRVDMTKENRYSLSEVSESALDTLAYPMFVTVYLDGDFPPDIRAFQDVLRTTLLEMKQYAHGNFDFEFVDPSSNPELQKQFQELGFMPVPVKYVDVDETRFKNMWPLAAFRYKDYEQYVDLLKGASVPTAQGPNVNFQKAESDLEYKLMSSVLNLSRERRGIVGLVRGHGELPNELIQELGTELVNSYNLVDFNMGSSYAGAAVSPDIDLLLIMQPVEAFSERDKYELDQYLMRGGSILWMLDYQKVDLDLFQKVSTLSELYELNLEDLFFKYGVKLNYDLVQDVSSETVELFDEASQNFASHRWLFYPRYFELPNHPVTRNIDAVMMRYASSIDTMPQAGVKKTVFLSSTTRSRTVQGRQFIDINQYVQSPPPANLFNRQGLIMGLMMEGVFESLFTGREAPTDSLAPEKPTATFGARNNPASPGKMAIISDGAFPQPRNFRGRLQRVPFDNVDLVMNVIDYLAGDQALTEIRSKEVVARRLDRDKARDSAGSIRLLNLVLPNLLILLFGMILFYARKRKYSRSV